MSVGFGFSAGDFLQAIKLVGTVIDSLSASSKSSDELRELLHQLYSLETALRDVKVLEVHQRLHAELLALKQSAAQCQRTISDFLDRTQAYQPQVLNTYGTKYTLQAKWSRLKWAICTKREVVKFKSDLWAHTESIQMLLGTLQMKSMQLDQNRQEQARTSLASQIQAGFGDCMARLCPISDTLSTISARTIDCLENTRQIISMNIRVFQMILDTQNHLKNIPGQVERQQPVYLNDALGRYTPFHLEFIRSPEALVSVLSINFKWIGSAAEKIQNGDFAIHDTHTKQDIELSRSWEECFVPGQHVEMSMIFERPERCTNFCPKCQSGCVVKSAKDVKCETCGLVFRSFSDPRKTFNAGSQASAPSISVGTSQVLKHIAKDEEDLTKFQRVRLRTMKPRISSMSWSQLLGGMSAAEIEQMKHARIHRTVCDYCRQAKIKCTHGESPSPGAQRPRLLANETKRIRDMSDVNREYELGLRDPAPTTF